MKKGNRTVFQNPWSQKKPTLSLEKEVCFKKAYKFIWKKGIEPSSKIPEAKETNTLIEKTILFQKSLQIHMKKGHRSVFQNAWIQKRQHSHWKNNVSKKLANSYEKMPENRFPKCLKPKKTNTLIEKTILFQKSLQIHMKKGHRTVFQNAWIQKRQHSHWKNNSVSKKLTNSYEKMPQNRFPKCLKPKKTNTLIEKTILFQKSLQIHMKKGHRTVFQNAWIQKRQHSHWKNNSVSKKLTNSYEKMPQNRFPKCLKPKKPTLSLKKQFCFKKAYNFIWKNDTGPFSKMPEVKKTNTLIGKRSLFQKSL